MKKRASRPEENADKKSHVIRSRVTNDLKERVLAHARKRLSSEGQVIREAVSLYLESQGA